MDGVRGVGEASDPYYVCGKHTVPGSSEILEEEEEARRGHQQVGGGQQARWKRGARGGEDGVGCVIHAPMFRRSLFTHRWRCRVPFPAGQLLQQHQQQLGTRSHFPFCTQTEQSYSQRNIYLYLYGIHRLQIHWASEAAASDDPRGVRPPRHHHAHHGASQQTSRRPDTIAEEAQSHSQARGCSEEA